MQKLISELTRLYLSPGALSPDVLERNMRGETTVAVNLAGGDGRTRAIVIDFRTIADGEPAQHWHLLCAVANALQHELGLPAPAVSISGADGFALWLSLEAPVSTAMVQEFMELLRKSYFPSVEFGPDAATAPVELPPCLHQRTGKWAAFINPGLGASFADESGLEMMPPLAGQVALLEGLHSISEPQFMRAAGILRQLHGVAPVASEPVSLRAPQGLLLNDATLEEIVRHLHSKNIEPTFRHVIGKK
jgi:hypothetical protein